MSLISKSARVWRTTTHEFSTVKWGWVGQKLEVTSIAKRWRVAPKKIRSTDLCLCSEAHASVCALSTANRIFR
jgi:hypothetical protein